MLSYVGKRILMFIPTIIIISFLIFFIIQLPPGDYVTSYVAAMAAEGEIFTPEQIADLRVQFGLDDPWFVQRTSSRSFLPCSYRCKLLGRPQHQG